MKHGQLWKGDLYTPGRCVACDVSLARREGSEGAPRRVLCGSPDCKRMYWALRNSRRAELGLKRSDVMLRERRAALAAASHLE